ncbi:MAG: biotin synthase BioB [Candidatus Gastranaerophilales bacterium]|nr:biotin synthase BioB [Candidatus Gastranaerophilales bacterium]
MKTKEELLKLYNLPLDELLKEAKKYTFKEFEFCSLISARTGKCSQNCKYCSQSTHYNTEITTHPLVSVEEVVKTAKESKENGAINFAIVTSGKTPDEAKDFNELLKMIKEINALGLKSCASIGICSKELAKQLKEAGLNRFHHNINTCKSYHSEICTTHTYQDRIDTCKNIKEVGIELCCGVIIGMGETVEQRIEMAMELADIAPDSIPVNLLTPIKGTPFENYFDKIDEENIIRTIAVFKIANPNSSIRLAGGKKARLSEENIQLLIDNCVDSAIVGNYLTTTGFSPDNDKQKVKKANKILKEPV